MEYRGSSTEHDIKPDHQKYSFEHRQNGSIGTVQLMTSPPITPSHSKSNTLVDNTSFHKTPPLEPVGTTPQRNSDRPLSEYSLLSNVRSKSFESLPRIGHLASLEDELFNRHKMLAKPAYGDDLKERLAPQLSYFLKNTGPQLPTRKKKRGPLEFLSSGRRRNLAARVGTVEWDPRKPVKQLFVPPHNVVQRVSKDGKRYLQIIAEEMPLPDESVTNTILPNGPKNQPSSKQKRVSNTFSESKTDTMSTEALDTWISRSFENDDGRPRTAGAAEAVAHATKNALTGQTYSTIGRSQSLTTADVLEEQMFRDAPNEKDALYSNPWRLSQSKSLPNLSDIQDRFQQYDETFEETQGIKAAECADLPQQVADPECPNDSGEAREEQEDQSNVEDPEDRDRVYSSLVEVEFVDSQDNSRHSTDDQRLSSISVSAFPQPGGRRLSGTERLAGQGMRRPSKDRGRSPPREGWVRVPTPIPFSTRYDNLHGRVDSLVEKVRKDLDQVRRQSQELRVTGLQPQRRVSLSEAAQNAQRLRENKIRARKLRDLQRSRKNIDEIVRKWADEQLQSHPLHESANPRYSAITPEDEGSPDSTITPIDTSPQKLRTSACHHRHASHTSCITNLEYTTGYTPTEENMALSPVMLVAEEIPVARGRPSRKPARLVLREQRRPSCNKGPSTPIAVRSSVDQNGDQLPSTWSPSTDEDIPGQGRIESSSSNGTQIIEVDSTPPMPPRHPLRATGQRTIRAATPPSSAYLSLRSHRNISSTPPAAQRKPSRIPVLQASPLPMSSPPEDMGNQRVRSKEAKVKSRQSLLEDRLTALERENRLLEAALMAVLKTSGSLNAHTPECACQHQHQITNEPRDNVASVGVIVDRNEIGEQPAEDSQVWETKLESLRDRARLEKLGL